jgi:Ca-activated chloride channel family protein
MKPQRILFILAFVASVCLVINPWPTSNAQQTRQRVLLHVRVTDAANNPVRDVPQQSFQVTEDGVPQKIELFMNEEVPLTYGLLIDCSGSMRSQIQQVVEAGMRIVNTNKPEDETFLVRFVSSDIIETMQELTSDKELLRKGLEALYVEGGQTAVFDAVYLSAEYLAKKKPETNVVRRRALILVTDGEDRNSYYKKDFLLRYLVSTNTQVFTLALTKDLPSKKVDKAFSFLAELATDTGGRTYFANTPADIERVSSEIIKDIRTQYVLGYIPSAGEPPKGAHKVLVSVGENPGDIPNKEKRVAITRVTVF